MENEQYDNRTGDGDSSWRQRLYTTPLVRFIKKYPRLSAAAGTILFVLLIALPGSLEDKIMVVLRTVALGFLIAFGFYCFRALRKTKE